MKVTIFPLLVQNY